VEGCWCIAIDTLSTLGSLFSSIPPYRVARDSGHEETDIIRALQGESWDVCERNSSDPPQLAQKNGHLEERLGGSLWVEGHYRGLGGLPILEVVFEGLLALQDTNLVLGYVGPIIN